MVIAPRRATTSPPKRRRVHVVVRWMAGFVAAVLIGVASAAGALHWGLARIDRSLVAGLTGDAAAAAEPASDTDAVDPTPELLNVLVVGNDSREGLTREQIQEFGTGQAEGNRTDSIMLLQLELDGEGRGAALSFPRDLLVDRCDGSRGRINAAYQVGVERDGDGPSCLVETISEHTGVAINHYLEVSFAGFVNVVDAIGGVGLYLNEPLYDEKAHLDLPAGCVTLRGADALGFVRARQLDNDFGRIARQQRFMKETLREATRVGILANPSRLVGLIDAAASAIHTDEGLGVAEMREIALGMRRLTSEGRHVHTVPSDSSYVSGTWYVEEHPAKAEKLYASFRDGSVLDAPPQKPAKAPKPAVTVLNASGEDGLAAAASAYLESQGYTISEVGNDDSSGLESTRVLHPPQLADEAAELAELFPGAELIAGVDELPLTVKLGADLDGDDLKADGAGSTEAATDAPSDAESDSPADGESDAARSPEQTYRGAEMTDVDC